MCLIIERQPKFELPFEKFETAILNNPDGYGFSYPDTNGKLVTVRNPNTPDPEKLYRTINEELIEVPIMVHLRYTTAGETNMRNAHPFPILERDKDGVDLRMAHNGTLHKWKTAAGAGESDTRAFVRGYVRPLFKRLIKGMDSTAILSDDFIKAMLDDQLSSASVLSFIDGEGNTLVVNETGNGGKREDGWWYSNTYSFNKSHRQPKGSSVIAYPTSTTSNTGTTGTRGRFTDAAVVKFTDKYNLNDITDTFCLTDDTIRDISKSSIDSELLIKELMAELQKEKEYK